mmetsp:Transcript_8972/g.22507  ORF Transcript_8972/g.22507 Transcript_8972/m.22507 type:complete len:396 (-) Transcript_8972:485-1672(-)
MAWLISVTVLLISSNMLPFCSSIALLASEIFSRLACVSLKPATPFSRSMLCTSAISSRSVPPSTSSVRSSTCTSPSRSLTSFFFSLYSGSLDLISAYLARYSSSLTPAAGALLGAGDATWLAGCMAPSSCATRRPYSVSRDSFLSVRRSSLDRISSFFFVITLAICCVARSCWYALLPCASFSARCRRSVTAAMSALISAWRCLSEYRSASVLKLSCRTCSTACSRFCRFSMSRGILSEMSSRSRACSSRACSKMPEAVPSIAVARTSRRRAMLRWYLCSVCSSCCRCDASCCIRLISSSCCLRSALHASCRTLRFCTPAVLPFTRSIFSPRCMRSSSSCFVLVLSTCGSLLSARCVSRSLCSSTNCCWYALISSRMAATSASIDSSSGMSTGVM